tara:strand:- start:1917 stop:2144 length:228 start_codon:yes stop_codon:yes gene_type:complete
MNDLIKSLSTELWDYTDGINAFTKGNIRVYTNNLLSSKVYAGLVYVKLSTKDSKRLDKAIYKQTQLHLQKELKCQ